MSTSPRGDKPQTKSVLRFPSAIGLIFSLMGTFLIAIILWLETNRWVACIAIVLYLMLIVVAILELRNARRLENLSAQKEQADERLNVEISRTAQAELQQKRHQLLALQSQINPHFLYNTLDTFRGVALESGNKELSDMIAALSAMFKYSVNYDAEMVTINAELNYLSKYIQLQQLRFPGRLEYHEDIRCGMQQLLLEYCPRFVLQPIVENAIRHGLRDLRAGARITVMMEIVDNEFRIMVEDNGCGMTPQQVLALNDKFEKRRVSSEQSHGHIGIGFGNVNERIKMFCGPDYGLHVASTLGAGTQVSVCLPLFKEGKRNA